MRAVVLRPARLLCALLVAATCACASNPARPGLAANPSVVEPPPGDGTLRAEGAPADEQDWYALLGDKKQVDVVKRGRSEAAFNAGTGLALAGLGVTLGVATAVGAAVQSKAEDVVFLGAIGGVTSLGALIGGSIITATSWGPATGGARITNDETARIAFGRVRAESTDLAADVASTPAPAAVDPSPFPAWKVPDPFAFDQRLCLAGDALLCHKMGIAYEAGIRVPGDDVDGALARAGRFARLACSHANKTACPDADRVDAQLKTLRSLSGAAREGFVCSRSLDAVKLFESKSVAASVVERECAPLLSAGMQKAVFSVTNASDDDRRVLVAQAALEELCPSFDDKKALALCKAKSADRVPRAQAAKDVAVLLKRSAGERLDAAHAETWAALLLR